MWTAAETRLGARATRKLRTLLPQKHNICALWNARADTILTVSARIHVNLFAHSPPTPTATTVWNNATPHTLQHSAAAITRVSIAVPQTKYRSNRLSTTRTTPSLRRATHSVRRRARSSQSTDTRCLRPTRACRSPSAGTSGRREGQRTAKPREATTPAAHLWAMSGRSMTAPTTA